MRCTSMQHTIPDDLGVEIDFESRTYVFVVILLLSNNMCTGLLRALRDGGRNDN